MTQPPQTIPPQPSGGNGFVKPLLIGCGVVTLLLVIVGGVGAWLTFRAVGTAIHNASAVAGVAQGAVSQAQQAAGQDGGASPDPGQAAAQGIAALKGLVGGGKHHVDTLSREELLADLPETVDSFPRTASESRRGSFSGISGTSASATYGSGEKTVAIDVTDAANMSGLTTLMGIAMNVESEDDEGYEKAVDLGDVRVHEKWVNATKHAELIGIVGDRFMVDVTSDGVDMSDAEGAFRAVDAAKLEATAASSH